MHADDNKAKWEKRDRDVPAEHADDDVKGNVFCSSKLWVLHGEGAHDPAQAHMNNKCGINRTWASFCFCLSVLHLGDRARVAPG